MPVMKLYRRATAVHPELPLYLLALTLLAGSDGLVANVYDNYIWHQFHFQPQGRGDLELIREFPGLLNVALLAIFACMRETRVAAIAAGVAAVGMAGFGIKGDNVWLMFGYTLLWSTGTHMIMPLSSSLTMELGGETKKGRRLGQVSAVRTIGSVIGAAVVWLVFGEAKVSGGAQTWQFNLTFFLGAATACAAAFAFLGIKSVGSSAERPKFVMRERYWLYYALNILWGARKQVFLTFGRWVLVTVFLQQPTTFAVLAIVGAAAAIGFNPMVGHLVDRWGERTVLVADSALTVLVCLGYAGAQHLGLSDRGALAVIIVCFVADGILMATGLARDTYVAKSAPNRDELVATLSMGVTINHLVSMVVPRYGGMLWKRRGYESVFLVAAGLAVLNGIMSGMIRVPKRASDPTVCAGETTALPEEA